MPVVAFSLIWAAFLYIPIFNTHYLLRSFLVSATELKSTSHITFCSSHNSCMRYILYSFALPLFPIVTVRKLRDREVKYLAQLTQIIEGGAKIQITDSLTPVPTACDSYITLFPSLLGGKKFYVK